MIDDKTRGEDRAETAKRHDDSELIEDQPRTPGAVGRSGGGLQRDVATAHPEKRVRDPEAGDNLTKEQELHHGQSAASEKQRGD